MYRSANAVSLLSVLILSACVTAASDTQGETSVTEYNSSAARPAGYYGVGSYASDVEVAGWNIDVRPDGMGLPEGGGTAAGGEMLYEDQCAICHGSFGEGVVVDSGGAASVGATEMLPCLARRTHGFHPKARTAPTTLPTSSPSL